MGLTHITICTLKPLFTHPGQDKRRSQLADGLPGTSDLLRYSPGPPRALGLENRLWSCLSSVLPSDKPTVSARCLRKACIEQNGIKPKAEMGGVAPNMGSPTELQAPNSRHAAHSCNQDGRWTYAPC